MTEATNIQLATKSFRANVLTWNASKLRHEGETRGITGWETAPLSTLAEAIVQHERDQLRSDSAYQPETPTSPGPARKGVNRLNR
jgi:hypothetical protein